MTPRLPSVKRIPTFADVETKAPTMIGMARKKEYSAAARLSILISIEPTMVEPERDTPGKIERAWNRPMSAAFHSGSSIASPGSGFGASRSITSRITPPMIERPADQLRALEQHGP